MNEQTDTLVSDCPLCVCGGEGGMETRGITSSEVSFKGAEFPEPLKSRVALAAEGKWESFCPLSSKR